MRFSGDSVRLAAEVLGQEDELSRQVLKIRQQASNLNQLAHQIEELIKHQKDPEVREHAAKTLGKLYRPIMDNQNALGEVVKLLAKYRMPK